MKQNGFKCRYLDHTFTSDIVKKNGKIATSALDHIYLKETLKDITENCKLDAGSSDHPPIVACIQQLQKKAPKTRWTYTNYLDIYVS